MKSFSIIIFLLVFIYGCGGTSTDPQGGNGGTEPPPPTTPPADTTPPSPPANLEGVSGDGELTLNWGENTEPDFDGYKVYRAEESFTSVSGRTPLNSQLLSEAGYTDTNVENGTTYFYRITALDEDENESNVSSMVEITPFATPPSRP